MIPANTEQCREAWNLVGETVCARVVSGRNNNERNVVELLSIEPHPCADLIDSLRKIEPQVSEQLRGVSFRGNDS